MSVHINFDTGYLSAEEGQGLAAFLGVVQPSLLSSADLRRAQYSNQLVPMSIGYAAEASLPPEAQAAKTETAPIEPEAKPARKTRAKAETKANISTAPENRVDPETPEDAAKDEADEKAEVDADRDPEKPLTVEDLKMAMGLYVNKFTMEAAMEDGVAIFKSALGTPPEGERAWKVSLVGAAGQQALSKSIDAWEAAAAADKRFGALHG